MNMNVAVCLAALAAVLCSVESKSNPPTVKVYSYNPGEYGVNNTLICHVSDFHPPDIVIELKKNDVEIPGTKLTDLTFKPNWHFHLTRTVSFTPQEGDKYTCVVTHEKITKPYGWESNM